MWTKESEKVKRVGNNNNYQLRLNVRLATAVALYDRTQRPTGFFFLYIAREAKSTTKEREKHDSGRVGFGIFISFYLRPVIKRMKQNKTKPNRKKKRDKLTSLVFSSFSSSTNFKDFYKKKKERTAALC